MLTEHQSLLMVLVIAIDVLATSVNDDNVLYPSVSKGSFTC